MTLTLFLMIAAAVAAGTILAFVVAFTFKWLKNKIHNLISARNAKKVLVSDITALAKECENKIDTRGLDNLANQGFSKVIAAVDENNQVVGDVEFYKDKNINLDAEVEELLGEEKMVVVEE